MRETEGRKGGKRKEKEGRNLAVLCVQEELSHALLQ